MVKSVPSFFGRALVLSVLLHAALLYAGLRLIAPAFQLAPALPSDLKVSLRRTGIPAEAPVAPQLHLPQEAPRHASAAAPIVESRPRLEGSRARPGALAPAMAPRPLEGEAAQRAVEQLNRELPYPAEAIERGLQGEALVLLFLDAAGNAIAARLEASSGHALLDDAAVRAVRRLRALPDSAPREALVPVRFRLR
jgi:protein TonB